MIAKTQEMRRWDLYGYDKIWYAKVSIDELAKGKYQEVELDLPKDEEGRHWGRIWVALLPGASSTYPLARIQNRATMRMMKGGNETMVTATKQGSKYSSITLKGHKPPTLPQPKPRLIDPSNRSRTQSSKKDELKTPQKPIFPAVSRKKEMSTWSLFLQQNKMAEEDLAKF